MITKALIESNLSAKQIVARLLGEDAIPHDYNFPTEGGNFGGRGSKPPGYGGSGGRGNFGGGNDGGFDWDAWNGEPDDNGFNVPIKQGGAKRGQGNPDGPLDFDEFKDWFKNDFGEVGAGPDLDALLEIIPRLVKQGTSKQAIANVMRVRPDAIKQLTSILVGTVENNRDAHLVMDVCLASKIFDQQNLDWMLFLAVAHNRRLEADSLVHAGASPKRARAIGQKYMGKDIPNFDQRGQTWKDRGM